MTACTGTKLRSNVTNLICMNLCSHGINLVQSQKTKYSSAINSGNFDFLTYLLFKSTNIL